MAREFYEFDMRGVNYRVKPFSAAEGFAITSSKEQFHPANILRLTEVQTSDGAWVLLTKPRAIDEHVRDVTGFLAPHIVLSELVGMVRQRNFGFLDEWEAVKVPERFIVDYTPRRRANVQPIMSRIEGEGLATRRELEEYYSLKDAFDMFDASCLRAVNAAIAQERAEYEAKLKAKAKGRGG